MSERNPGCITLEELERKMLDPDVRESDIAPYFKVDEEGSGPMRPRLVLDETKVEVAPTPGDRSRGDMLLAKANWLARARRRHLFEQRRREHAGPVIVAEGDSWFQFPLLLTDIIDNLLDKGHLISSLDEAGDTLENMVREKEYLSELQRTGASILLLSAGGNDALGGSNLAAHLRDEDTALPAADLLLPSFYALVDHTLGLYERVVREVEALPGNVITICHGYDRPLPHAGKWLGKPMSKRGITDPQRQRDVARHMIDVFNGRLQQLARRFEDSMVYLDLRDKVGASFEDWHDELHPRNPGYARLAEHFDRAIGQAIDKRATPAAPLPRGRGLNHLQPPPAVVTKRRHGISLHVGLNRIDAAHYGTDGALEACLFDAEDMERIAAGKGFEKRTMLTDEQATRDAVKQAIAEAARELKAGDMFFLSYAGHGSQLPDFNRDELEDGADETLCLYDGMLLDDELFQLWGEFASDVRVLMISDSCHSGTVLRAMRSGGSMEPGPDVPRTRELPRDFARLTYRRHQQFYEGIGRSVRGGDERLPTLELAMPLRCSALLISGCQDSQTSRDGVVNGRFTQELLQVWNGGRFEGNYRDLHRRIVAGMPEDQRPNLQLLGPAMSVFVAQVPFAI